MPTPAEIREADRIREAGIQGTGIRADRIREADRIRRGGTPTPEPKAPQLPDQVNRIKVRLRHLESDDKREAASSGHPVNAKVSRAKAKKIVANGVAEIMDLAPTNAAARKQYFEEVRQAVGDDQESGLLNLFEGADKYLWRPVRSALAGYETVAERALTGDSLGVLNDFTQGFVENQQGTGPTPEQADYASGTNAAQTADLSGLGGVRSLSGAMPVQPLTGEAKIKEDMATILGGNLIKPPPHDAGSETPSSDAIRNAALGTMFLGAALAKKLGMDPSQGADPVGPEDIAKVYDRLTQKIMAPVKTKLTQTGYAVVGLTPWSNPEKALLDAQEAIDNGNKGASALLDGLASIIIDPVSYVSLTEPLKLGGVHIAPKATPLIEGVVDDAIKVAVEKVARDIQAPVKAAQESLAKATAEHQAAGKMVAELDASLARGVDESTRGAFLNERALSRIEQLDAEAVAERAARDLAEIQDAARAGQPTLEALAKAEATKAVATDMVELSQFAMERGLPLEGPGLLKVWGQLRRASGGMEIPQFANALADAVKEAKASGKIITGIESHIPLRFTMEIPTRISGGMHALDPLITTGQPLVSILHGANLRATAKVYGFIGRTKVGQGVLKGIESVRRATLGVIKYKRPQPLAGYTTDKLFRAFKPGELVDPATFEQVVQEVKNAGAIGSALSARRQLIIDSIKDMVPSASDRKQIIGALDYADVKPEVIRAAEGLAQAERAFRQGLKTPEAVAEAQAGVAISRALERGSDAAQEALAKVLDGNPSPQEIRDAMDHVGVIRQQVMDEVANQIRASRVFGPPGDQVVVHTLDDALAAISGGGARINPDGLIAHVYETYDRAIQGVNEALASQEVEAIVAAQEAHAALGEASALVQHTERVAATVEQVGRAAESVRGWEVVAKRAINRARRLTTKAGKPTKAALSNVADAFEKASETTLKASVEVARDVDRLAALDGLSVADRAVAVQLSRDVRAPRGLSPEIKQATEFIRTILSRYASDLKRGLLLAGEDLTTDEIIAGVDVTRLLQRFTSEAEARHAAMLAGDSVVSGLSDPKRLIVHDYTVAREADISASSTARQVLQYDSVEGPASLFDARKARELAGKMAEPTEEEVLAWVRQARSEGRDIGAIALDPVPLLAVFLRDADTALANKALLDRLLTRFPKGAQLSKTLGHQGDLVAQSMGYRRIGPTARATLAGSTLADLPPYLVKYDAEIRKMLGEGLDESTILNKLYRRPDIANYYTASSPGADSRYALDLQPVYLPLPVAEYIDWMYGPGAPQMAKGAGKAALDAWDGVQAALKQTVTVGRTMYGYLAANVIGNVTSQAQVLGASIRPKYIGMAYDVTSPAVESITLAGRRVATADVLREMMEQGVIEVASSTTFLEEQGLALGSRGSDSAAIKAYGRGEAIRLGGKAIVPTLGESPVLDALAAKIGGKPPITKNIASRSDAASFGGLSGFLLGGPPGAALGAVGGALGGKPSSLSAALAAMTPAARKAAASGGTKSIIREGLLASTGTLAGAFHGAVVGGAAHGDVGAAIGGLLGGITYPGLLRLMGELNQGVEGMARASTYLAARDVGKTPQEAIEVVNKALRDYADQTPIERGILRRAFYFWTWSAGNIKLQTEYAVKHPAKVDMVMHTLDSIYRGVYSEEELARFPGHNSYEIVLQTNRANYARNWLLPKLPYSEPLETLTGNGGVFPSLGSDLVGRLNPAVAMSVRMGEDIFGTDFEATPNAYRYEKMGELGFDMADAALLPKAFRSWLGLRETKPAKPGRKPAWVIDNPERYWLVQQMPLWTSLSSYLRIMTQPWDPNVDGPVPSPVLKTTLKGLGVRVTKPKTAEELLSIRQWQIDRAVNDAAIRYQIAKPGDPYFVRQGEPAAP